MNKTYINQSYPNSETLQAKAYNDPQVAQQCALLPLNALRLFTIIGKMDIVFKKIVPSRATLGHLCGGLSQKTITRMSQLLQHEGLIEKTRDLTKPFDTCKYELTPAGRHNKKRIKHLLKMWGVVVFSLSFLASSKSVSEPTVSPYSYKDLYLYKKNERSDHPTATINYKKRVSEENNARARMERSMEHDNFITPELRTATKNLNLTKWAQIRLSMYPSGALSFANQRFMASRAPKGDMFKWYTSLCDEWCRKANKEPNLSLMRRLAVEHCMPDNAPMILERKVVIEEVKTSKVIERRHTPTPEELFIARVETVDKLQKLETDNPFAQILMNGFRKQIVPYFQE